MIGNSYVEGLNFIPKKAKICSYNIKWFKYQFNSDNTFKTFGSSKKDKSLQAQRDGMIATLNAVNPDIFGIVEASNTTTTVEAQSTVENLKKPSRPNGVEQI